jgi:uracil DNA glycosylase
MRDVVQKICKKLEPSGWYSALRIFLESSDFLDIIEELKRKVDVDKQRFCPALNIAFRFLEQVPVEKVKAVMLVDHIFNTLEEANGIPLRSGTNTYPDRTPLTLYRSIDDLHDHDSSKWVEQGVLLIPLSITCRIDGKPHKKLWAPIVMRLIEVINRNYSDVPWVLLGSNTFKYEEDIVSPHLRKLELYHPIQDRKWSQWINMLLKEQRKGEIKW